MKSYRVELIYEVNGIEISNRIEVTTQTYNRIIDEKIKEISQKYGINESEIRVNL